MFERGFLIFSAIIWLPYGLYCFFQPGSLAEAAGVVATIPTATTELRAMYGGLQMAIGALALVSLARPRLARIRRFSRPAANPAVQPPYVLMSRK